MALGRRCALGFLLVAMLGCEREPELRVYRAPKQGPGMPGDAGGHEHHHHDGEGEEILDVTHLPAGWEVLPEERPMRFATVRAGEVEVAISRFPGDVGGRANNVNRWRDQLGLAPLAPADAERSLTALSGTAVPVETLELDNPERDMGMLAAILPRAEQTWFVKATGPRAALTAQREAFLTFLRGLRFSAGAHEAGAPAPAQPAPSQPVVPAFTAPAGWVVDPAPAPPRLAAFRVGAEGAEAEVTLTAFPGEVGGLLLNLNRWRGQVGLPPLGDASEQTLEPVEVDGQPGQVADLEGPGGRLLAALLPQPGWTWFVKLQGPPPLVGSQREAFLAFVRSLRFAAPGPQGPLAPSGPPGPQGPGALGPGGPPDPGGEEALTWTAPGSWSAAAARPPRVASFQAGEAEVSVTRFPGEVGGWLDNVNRWRGQVGLGPVDAPPAEAVALSVAGGEARVLDLDGPDGRSLSVALLARGGATWFVKLSGPTAAVRAERARWREFLTTLGFEGGGGE